MSEFDEEFFVREMVAIAHGGKKSEKVLALKARRFIDW